MVSALISRAVVLGVGTLYPAYRSYKAVRTKDVREYVKWMMYWIVFALYLCLETVADIFASFWVPFYYELKIIFVFWLITPYTKGASVLYRKFIHPALQAHEDEIDEYLDRAKSTSYSTLLNFGTKGVQYAREVATNAVVNGQMSLVNQLKKSYSMSDINADEQEDEAYQGRGGPRIEEIIEEDEDGLSDGRHKDENRNKANPPAESETPRVARRHQGFKVSSTKRSRRNGGSDKQHQQQQQNDGGNQRRSWVGYYEDGKLVEREAAAAANTNTAAAVQEFEELDVATIDDDDSVPSKADKSDDDDPVDDNSDEDPDWIDGQQQTNNESAGSPGVIRRSARSRRQPAVYQPYF